MKAINSCENYTNASIGAVVNGKGIISVTDNVSGQKLEKLDVFVESNSTYEDIGIYSKNINQTSFSNEIYAAENFYSTSMTLTEMACNIAGLYYVSSSDQPSINSGSDYQAYCRALSYLNEFTPIQTFNHYSPGAIGKGSVEKTIFTYDHQYFLYALTDKYSNKSAYANQDYEIDAYLIMGIGFGESNASQTSSNPFGATGSLSPEKIALANSRAIRALQDCGLASNATQASNLMNSDPFYAKAAQVLSYMDNGLAYGTPLNVNYQSLNQAMPNVNRWRNAVENGSTNPDDFGYRYF
ncbi:MAG: hypothetical protein J6C38_06515 [Oscillospiraceae bacterium]|nr:hypothetical protein [Oscillospiraceae bacterium]